MKVFQIAAKFEPFPDIPAAFARNRSQKKSPFRSSGLGSFQIRAEWRQFAGQFGVLSPRHHEPFARHQ